MKKRLQVVLLFMLIGIVALGATGCSMLAGSADNTTATATPAPDATVPPQQVVDAEYTVYDAEKEFSITYHSKWMIKDDFDNAAVVFTIPEGMVQSEETAARVYPTLTVFQFAIAEDEKENFNLQTYVNDQLTYLESKVYQFTLLKEMGTLTIGNTTAYVLEYVGAVLNANEVKTKQVFLTDGEYVFILTYAANADFYSNDNYLAIADKMINSFTLK